MQFRNINKGGQKFRFAPKLAGFFRRGAFSPPPVGFISNESPISTHCQTTKNSVLLNPKSIPGRESTATALDPGKHHSSSVCKAFVLWV